MNLTTKNGVTIRTTCVYHYDLASLKLGVIFFEDPDGVFLHQLQEAYPGVTDVYLPSYASKPPVLRLRTMQNPVNTLREVISLVGATVDGDLEALWCAMRDIFMASVKSELVRIRTFLHVTLAVRGLIKQDGAPGLDRKIEVVYSNERWLTRYGSDAHHPTLEVNRRLADVASMVRHLEHHKVRRSALDDVVQDSIRSYDRALEALRNHQGVG